MHHEPKIPEKATHSSSASQVAMQSCCLACPCRKSNTRFGLPGCPHFFPFLDVSAMTELCESDTLSSTVKAFAAPSKRIHVIINVVVVVKKRRVPMCRVINFTKGHFYTLLRIIVSSVFLESRRLRRRRRQTKKKVIAHHYTRGGGGRATLSRSKPS
jgi:hypothetical protein